METRRLEETKMEDLMTLFANVIRDGLRVREGEVITEDIIRDRVGNLTMGLLAALPSYHRLKLRREAKDGFWTAMVEGLPGEGIGVSPWTAVASCLVKLLDVERERGCGGSCLIEIPDFAKASRDFHSLGDALLSGCGETEADTEISAVEKGSN
jgi:hypothetical protein